MPGHFDFYRIEKFKRVEPELAKIIEDHLPGDFTSWEEENTSWEGKVKTVHNSFRDPRTSACAWAIYVASIVPEEFLGHVEVEATTRKLETLERSLSEAVKALGEISPFVISSLSKGAADKLRTLYGPPKDRVDPPDVTLVLIEQAMKEGIKSVKERLSEVGAERTKANLQAAAVARACSDVYQRRTGKTAPKFVQDQVATRAEHGGVSVSPFVRFTKGVFELLGVTGQVSSALNLLHRKLDS